MSKLHRALALWMAMALVGGLFVADAHAKGGKKPAAKKEEPKAKKDSGDKKAAAKKDDKAAGDDAAKSDEGGDKPEKEAKKEEIRTTGPAKLRRPTSEKDFDRSEKADAKRDDQIKTIKDLLPSTTDAQTKGELVFRLAELYWDKSRFVLDQEYREYEKVIEKWQQNGSKGNEPEVDHKKSEVFKKQALANYSIILEKYPDYPRRDEVLYIMASNTYEAGKKDKAIQHYWELIKQYPTSEYVGDAYLAMGEHYFNSNDVTKAQKAFKKALETKKPKVYSYALYKLAWCDYNLQEWDGALKKFKEVVNYSDKQAEKAKKAGVKDNDPIQLKSEALQDITLTFSHVEAVDTAYDYLKEKGGNEKARKLTGKLAGYYMDQGKYDSAIQTFRLLINYYPEDPDCPDFQSSIVAAFFKMNKRDEIRTEVKRLVELYRPGTPWWKKNEKNKRTVEKAREIAEERMRELVVDTHAIYTKLKKQDDAELARDMYSDYLKVFPDSEHAYRLRFFYAEILWDLGAWPEAATQYDVTVENDAKNKYKGDYTRQAAYNAILAYEKIAKGEKGEFKAAGGKGAKGKKEDVKRKEGEVSFGTVKRIDKTKKTIDKEEIPENEIKLAAACDKYVVVVPVTEKTSKELTDELVLVKFKAGAIYQNRFHFEEAAGRFEELIDRWPTHEFARKGADLILDSWDFRENWTELNRVGRKFQKNKTLMAEKDFSARVDKFVEGSSFKEILVLYDKAKKLEDEHKTEESTPMFADIATRFMGFQKEFPTSQFADKAVFNSVVIYDKADKLDLAVDAGELLLKQYEKSEQVKPTVYLIAQFHERMAEFKSAAEYYERYVQKYPKEKEAPDALYNAALFHQGMGERKKAVELYGKYIKDFKDQSDVADVYWKIARIYEDDGDLKRAGTLYSEFEKNYPKAPINRIIESRYNFMLSLMAEGKKREGDVKSQCDDMLKRISKMKDEVKKDSVIQKANAHCSFMALEPRFNEYMDIKLVLPMEKLKKNLEAKATKLEQLKNDYTAVLAIGDGAWGVAALYRVAVVHHEFAKALKESPDPPKLNIDQLEMYRSELESQIFPVDEKAIAALEAALAKAFELGIYTEWTAKCQDLLKEYKPNEFPAVHNLPFYYSDFFAAVPKADKGGK
ncbi:MAG: tetratricopeptide repeat protein [Deltaproteobacteria bacterium]|nr:tetratricopeptide repeat protein [Deltaproteobacteria bacterium]